MSSFGQNWGLGICLPFDEIVTELDGNGLKSSRKMSCDYFYGWKILFWPSLNVRTRVRDGPGAPSEPVLQALNTMEIKSYKDM